MAQKKKASQLSSKTLPKASTGIQGLDEITGGGLPRGRPTLVSGGAGSGKTLFGLEFLVRGATQFSEPGVFMSFEESIPDLTKNVASLGFDLDRLVAEKKLFVDHVSITRSEFGETGEYDLEGLFIRIADAVQRVGARRVVLDTLEALFGELPNPGIVRSEIRRLFNWLKQKELTTVITAERDQPDKLTRHGIEEFVSDCVILLDHRIREEISTRRLRIVKYRGSTHGTNEYPFLIDDQGISVLPISSLGLNHDAPAERVSSGIARLDGMLGAKGFYRGSSILASGTAGTGMNAIVARIWRTRAVLALVAGTCAASLAQAQSDDWTKYIRDQLSADPAVREAAAKNMRNAMDAALQEDVATVRKHVASIAPAFKDENEQTRLAAAGVCYLLAQLREDSVEAIAPSIPALLSLTRDKSDQVRAAAFRSLGFLRPKPPPEVIAAMRGFVRDPDSTARGMAMLAIARSFAKRSDDEKLLKELLSDPQPLIRKSAVEAVGVAMSPGYVHGAHDPDAGMIEILRQRLSDPDTAVIRSAIRTIDEIGPPAISAEDDLRKIVDANVDRELSQAAAAAIRRITAPPPKR